MAWKESELELQINSMENSRADFEKKTFIFKQPSGTSRGILSEKHAWFLKIWNVDDPTIVGIGECSIIPGLSPDFIASFMCSFTNCSNCMICPFY